MAVTGVIFIIAVFLALSLSFVIFVLGIGFRNKAAIISSLVMAAFILGSVYLIYNPPGSHPAPERLTSPPNEELLTGTYTLDHDAAVYLNDQGYSDLAGKLIFNKDKTFNAVNLPRKWIGAADTDKTNTSWSGKWFYNLASNQIDLTNAPDQSQQYLAALAGAEVCQPGHAGAGYILALQVYDGADFVDVYLVKQENPQKQ